MAIAAEIPFEFLIAALETTKGTPIAIPTHYLPLAGMITPEQEEWFPDETSGTLAEYTSSTIVAQGAKWTGNGGVSAQFAPFLFNLLVGAQTTPATPVGATTARLWTFNNALTSDTSKSATLWFGDPNVTVLQSAYCMATKCTISADASKKEAATWKWDGFGRFPVDGAAPTLPARIPSGYLMPGAMQLWLDPVASAYGTTEVTGRFISSDWDIPTGISQKRYAGGPGNSLNFTKHGRGKRHAEAKITVELNTDSLAREYQTLYKVGADARLRIRLNGNLIEAGFYEYVQLDIMGKLGNFAWGVVEKTNRTMTFVVKSKLDPTPGLDYTLSVQNARTTL